MPEHRLSKRGSGASISASHPTETPGHVPSGDPPPSLEVPEGSAGGQERGRRQTVKVFVHPLLLLLGLHVTG